MITILAHHYVLPDKLKEAKERIQGSGQQMRSSRGFISRQTLISQSPPKITSVTTWRSQEDYQAWETPERKEARRRSPNLWSRPVEVEVFEVIPEL